uniref:NB-ARC domain-containing protein n=1 Tax=Salix viminalis TaxID=40686 RepID=A0A6N2M362_SALVM
MAGVGTTELLNHLHNDLLQSQDSTHRLYWVPVSQNCSNERLQNLIAKSIGVDLSSEDDGLRRSVNVPEEIKEAALGRNGSSHMPLDSTHRLYWVPVSQNCSNERLQNLIAKSIGVDLSSEDDGLRRSVNVPEEIKEAALGRNALLTCPLVIS